MTNMRRPPSGEKTSISSCLTFTKIEPHTVLYSYQKTTQRNCGPIMSSRRPRPERSANSESISSQLDLTRLKLTVFCLSLPILAGHLKLRAQSRTHSLRSYLVELNICPQSTRSPKRLENQVRPKTLCLSAFHGQ